MFTIYRHSRWLRNSTFEILFCNYSNWRVIFHRISANILGFFSTKFERENKKSSTINIFLMEHFTNKIITAQTYSKCWWCVDGALFRCVHTCTKISLSLVCGEFRTLIVSLTGAKLSLFVPVSIPHKTQSRFFSRKNRENSPSSLIKIHRKYFWIKFWTIIYRLHTIYHHLHEYFSYFERKKDYLSRRHYQSML